MLLNTTVPSPLVPSAERPPSSPDDPSQCRLLGPTALVVQGLSESTMEDKNSLIDNRSGRVRYIFACPQASAGAKEKTLGHLAVGRGQAAGRPSGSPRPQSIGGCTSWAAAHS